MVHGTCQLTGVITKGDCSFLQHAFLFNYTALYDNLTGDKKNVLNLSMFEKEQVHQISLKSILMCGNSFS